MKVVVTQSNAIKKKLMAATSMLLVAVIMLVSSTYAWFTLSTAPEVTGITTTVGANGNLEMALATKDTWGTTDPGSTVGTSMTVAEVTEANITWGNLVDLESLSYGLGEIKLAPSRLNLTAIDQVSTTSILETPTYGHDGRVATLDDNTTTAIYKDGAFPSETTANITSGNIERGVRAIGTASNMTARQLSYRNALGNLSNNMSAAKIKARVSLESNGGSLAGIVIKYNANNNATYTYTEVEPVLTAITDLQAAYACMYDAWENVVIGFVTSGTSGLNDNIANAVKEKIEKGEYSVTVADGTMTFAFTGTDTTDLPALSNINSSLQELYLKIYDSEQNLLSAKTAMQSLVDSQRTDITWSDLSTPIGYLVNSSYVTVNNRAISSIMADKSQLMKDVTDGKGVNIQMLTGAGAYADIADLCGDYRASVILPEGSEVSGFDLAGMTVGMETNTSVDPVYFQVAYNSIVTAGSPSVDTSLVMNITDYYGYAIDLLFRTNAADAKLQLQTEGAQRIYSESDNADTQGSGSNMTFASTSNSFSNDQLKLLMGAIRVVFIDEKGEILSFAKLDIANAKVAETGLQADLLLYDIDTTKTVEINGKFGQVFLKDTPNVKDDGTTYDPTLMTLSQNEKTKMTVIVYLDGDVVTNAMVANAASSMTGSLNLQFSTDVTLTPMENSVLKGSTSTTTPEATTTTTITPTPTTASN